MRPQSRSRLFPFLVFLIPLVYYLGVTILSQWSAISFNEVILFSFDPVFYPHPFLANYMIKPVVTLCSILIILFVPGVSFTSFFFRKKSNFSLVKFLSLAFFLNILILFLITTMLKLIGITVERSEFIILVFLVNTSGLLLNAKNYDNFDFAKYKVEFLYVFLLALIMIGLVLCFSGEVLKPLSVNFQYQENVVIAAGAENIGDPQEEFGIAYHLKERVLPYWFVERLGRFGIYIYDPHLSYFLNFFTIILFGESYASLNILSLVFMLGIFLVFHKVISLGSHSKGKNPIVYFFPVFFLFSFFLLLMEGARRIEFSLLSWPSNNFWDPIDSLWVFLLMAVILFLLKKDFTLVFVYSLLATFCRYESIFCIFTLVALYYYFFREEKESIKIFLKHYSFFIILFLLYSLLLIIYQGGGLAYLRGVIGDKIFIRFDWLREIFSPLSVKEKIWPYFSWSNTRQFIRWSLVSTYFFLPFFFIPSEDKITKFLSLFGIIYFVLMFTQSFKLITYVCFLIPLAGVNARRFIYPPLKVKLLNLFIYVLFCFMGVYYIL